MGEWIGVIPAAGLGTRAYPYTATIPKGLLPVDGVPLLQRNLELLRDQVGVAEVRIVIGYRGEAIEQTFGDGSRLGLRLRYVRNDRLDLGLAHSIRLAGRSLEDHDGPSVLLLSDECYVGTDHRRLRELSLEHWDAACGILHTDIPGLIRRNYSVELDGDRIARIVEKPRVLPNQLLGTGTYVLTPVVYEALEAAFGGAEHRPEWMTFLDGFVQAGGRVRAVDLGGDYANVNSKDELNRANLLVRNHDFAAKRTSVVVVSDHAPRPLADVLRRFAREDGVFEVVVVSPTELPRELAAIPKVRGLVAAAGSSFGDRTRQGLDAAEGELLVLTQSDDSFSPDDLPKLLGYIRDADLVVGTRTTRQMIEQGANMRGIVRIAHILLAKLMEQLWRGRGARFTDVGCVYRAIWKSTWDLIAPHVRADGQEIYPEMVLEILHARRRVIEVPVNYYNRDPLHAAVTSSHQTARTFLRILGLILRRSLFRRGG